MIAHEEFRQLSALATSGCLTRQEQSRLETHLASCAECREVAREYENVARIGVPSLAPDFPAESPQIPFGWSEELAYRNFLDRLGERSSRHTTTNQTRPNHSPTFDVIPLLRKSWCPQTLYRSVPYAVGIAVALLIGLLGYEIGTRRVGDLAVRSQQRYEDIDTAARTQIVQLSTERELLVAKAQESDKSLGLLRAEVAERLFNIKKLRAEELRLRHSLQDGETEKNKTAAERDESLHQLGQMQSDLERARADLSTKQKELDTLGRRQLEATQRAAQLETRVAQLEELLKDRDDAINRQQDLLAYDRDIRDLIGARDLYVAEVFDVGHNGKTKKPFGRVFFTKGKSLIFYAYDLDQEHTLRNASSFQAWGRRGPDVSKAASLGIFYQDSSSHRRWVVKSSDPNLIQQLDAVFVTVEPKGGSQKPTGKQLLFAYLRVEPNHP
jgi:hypothetical protein